MNVSKIYSLAFGRFFLLYILFTLAISILMAGLYTGYLYLATDSHAEWLSTMKNTISVGFSIASVKASVGDHSFSAFLFIFFVVHSFVLLLINMLLQAFITARLIKPATRLLVSDHATFHPHYGHGESKEPHILFRLINAGPSKLYSLSLKAFFVIKLQNEDGEITGHYYFPVQDIDPQEIPVIDPYGHWKVAIPIQPLSNSYINDYELNLHRADGSVPGERTVEIVVSGTESAASSSFIHPFAFTLEKEAEGGFFCGDFESLPTMLSKKTLPGINIRHPMDKASCKKCALAEECVYKAQ